MLVLFAITVGLNLLAYEFDGRKVEDLGLANRVIAAADLEGEVQALTDLMLEKNRYAIRRTKFVLNKAAEGHLAQATAFAVRVDPGAGIGENVQGIRDFADKTQG